MKINNHQSICLQKTLQTAIVSLLLLLLVPVSLFAQEPSNIDSFHTDWPELLYATYWGGSDYDEAENMIVDALGNIIIAGQTWSTDLPVTNDAFQAIFGGESDVFVAKFSPANTLIWATYVGGDSSEYANGLALDADGNIYM